MRDGAGRMQIAVHPNPRAARFSKAVPDRDGAGGSHPHRERRESYSNISVAFFCRPCNNGAPPS
jgi:hypothetical protein